MTIDPTTPVAPASIATPGAPPIPPPGAAGATTAASATIGATPAQTARPGRPLVGGLTLAAVALLLALDLLTTERINPFTVPPPAAFGSGLTTAGAHCAVPN